MTTVSEADRRLLATLVGLTERDHGRPPSLAELTLALGFQASSRANIHRRLSRLRPTYVDWSPGSRALRVTPAGQAVAKGEAVAADMTTAVPCMPASPALLHLLASGLTHLAAAMEDGRPLRAPYPHAWQRGVNMLAAECIAAGMQPPTHTAQAIAWCQRPITSWPIRFSGPSRQLDMPLLDEDRPTALCRELAFKGDAEMELCERIMVTVLKDAHLHRIPAAYVAFRRFVVEHPVVAQEDLLRASFDTSLDALGVTLHELYEQVPSTVLRNGEVLLCGFCGWTLERHHGSLRCGDDRCRILTHNFTQGTKELPVSADPLLRVRRAIRRYVVAPGVYEVGLCGALEALGATVELWPGYDAYDLRVSLDDGAVWALDVKDYRFPHLLAPRLDVLESGLGIEWSEAFYVVPDARVREMPGYLDFLRSATTQAGAAPAFEIVTMGGMIARVSERMARMGGRNGHV